MIHTKLSSISGCGVPSVSERAIMTTCVNGSTAIARYWMDTGRRESGKKVPLNRNMGVMNRNMG